jgi:DNA polymerase III gamma/tau subunit
VQRAHEQGAEMRRLAEDVAERARNLLLAALPGVKQDLPDHELRSLSQEAEGNDPAQLSRVFDLLQAAQDEVQKAANPRHALEVALLRAVYLAPAGSLPELVARVEQLSSGAPAAKPERTDAPAAKLERKTEPARLPETALLQSRWKQLIEAVKAARKPAAASALEHGSPLKIDPSGVQLAFRRGDARAAIVAEVKADIEAVFERALGYRAPLQLVEQEPEGATVAEEKQKQRSAAQTGRLTLGREHPAVRSAVELLGGEIEDVRDLGEE